MKFLKNRARCIACMYEVDGRDNLNVRYGWQAQYYPNLMKIFSSLQPCSMYVQTMCIDIQVVRPLYNNCIRCRWSEAHMLGEDRKELQSFCILALLQYITSENIFRISMVWSRNIRTKHTVQHTCAQWRMDMLRRRLVTIIDEGHITRTHIHLLHKLHCATRTSQC